MLPSHGVSGTGANVEWAGAEDEAALQLFNKHAPRSVRHRHAVLIAPLCSHALAVTKSLRLSLPPGSK